MATVSIVSQSSSPDLASYVNVVANTPNGNVAAQVPLTVNAIFEVDIMNAGNLASTGVENWSI